MKRLAMLLSLALATLMLSSCAAVQMSFEDFARAWKGIPATMTTYDQLGGPIDRVHGTSFQMNLDERFTVTSVDSDGTTSTAPGDMLLLSVGKSHISHVGSTMILAEDGVVAVAGADEAVDIKNAEDGTRG